MNPELPYLRKTSLFNGSEKESLRGYSQVKNVCEKACQHFDCDEKLIQSKCDGLIRRVNTRIVSNAAAVWEINWPKLEGYISKEFPKPPQDFASATEFFNFFIPLFSKQDIEGANEYVLQAGYWFIQLIEERCNTPDIQEVSLDLENNPVSILIRLIDSFYQMFKNSAPDPFYASVVTQFEMDFTQMPFMKGIELIGNEASKGDRGAMGILALVLGDFLDGARHAVDDFNGSHSCDDSSVLILLISEELLKEFNEKQPNIEKIAKLAERLKDAEFNLIRLNRETPVIGTQSLDPLRSKVGGEVSPWHVAALQSEIDKVDPDFGWKSIFNELSHLGDKVSHSEIKSITCINNELVITPVDSHRDPVTIKFGTLRKPTYSKPSKLRIKEAS